MEDVADKTAAININGGEGANGQEPSKNALKKAQKQQRLAAEKATKSSTSTVKETARAEAKKAVKVAPKKKIEGAALVGVDVAKEVDFSSWYQQVLTKGDFLDYYDVSGCYILRVRSSPIPCFNRKKLIVLSAARRIFYLGGNPGMVQQEDQKYWCRERGLSAFRFARRVRERERPSGRVCP